jgi:hypothetical protein
MDALKKARAQGLAGKKGHTTTNSISEPIMEKPDEERFTSPKARTSNRPSTRNSNTKIIDTDDKNKKSSRNMGPIISDGKGIYDSSESTKPAKVVPKAEYKFKSNLQLTGSGKQDKNMRQSVMNLKLKKQ